MDNLTHSITGLTLSRAGLGRFSPLGTATLLVSSNFPDLDAFIEMAGGLERDQFFSHRGITHSLAAAPLEVCAIATVMWIIGRLVLKRSSAVSWRKLAMLASVGLAVHLLLDLTNQYGVRALLPFSARWYAWDLTSLLDFWVLMILALGWLVPAFWRGCHPEQNDARGVSRLAAAFSLVLLAGFMGVKQMSHWLALNSLDTLAASHRALRIACLPGSLSPFRWTGVLETVSGFEILNIEIPRGVVSTRQLFPKNCAYPLEQAARKSAKVQALLSFARFPIFHGEPWTTPNGGVGYTVLVEDLRWLAPRGYVFGPCVRVWMTGDLQIVREKAESWR